MREEVSKNPLNVPGRFYVDCETCLDHAVCVEAAPDNFRQDENYSAYVFKQPADASEEARCRRALEDCPVGAIHDDGGPES